MQKMLNPEVLSRFSDGKASFCLEKCGKIEYICMGRGIGPALDAQQKMPELLRGATVYDTIVGKAAAALFILGGAEFVYGETVSDCAVELLTKHGIGCSWKIRTKEIVNRRGDGLCPFEQAVLPCRTPEECLPVIRETMQTLRA